MYIPLGGNRKGLTRTCMNTLIVFAVSGLWHGAAWTYVLWGFLHGIAMVIWRLFGKWLSKLPGGVKLDYDLWICQLCMVLFSGNLSGTAFAFIHANLQKTF